MAPAIVSRATKSLALAAIRIYQRVVSPYKGYACAYRVHTGKASCSNLGLRAIQRYGLARGLGVLRMRFAQCAGAHRDHAPARTAVRHQEGGYCDLACDGVSCDALSCLGEGLECGPCEFPGGKGTDARRKRRRGATGSSGS